MCKKAFIMVVIPVYIIGMLVAGGAEAQSREYFAGPLSFTLISIPENASVILDEKVKGFTPMVLELFYLRARNGIHNDETRERFLKIEKQGYEPYVLSFSVQGKEYEKIPNLIHLKSLDATVNPADSQVQDKQNKKEFIDEKIRAEDVLKENEQLKTDNEKLREEVTSLLLERVNGTVNPPDSQMEDEQKRKTEKASIELLKIKTENEKLRKEIALLKKNNDTQEMIQHTEKKTENQYVNRLFYTIQTGSYARVKEAQKQFMSMIQRLYKKDLDYLRIEKIGKFYSIRIGKFDDYKTAEKSLRVLNPQLSTAIILKAYIKDERTISLFSKSTS
jgi:hypothetical protein